MKKGQFLDKILRSENTVFSINDIALLWGEASSASVRNRLQYYVKKQQLFRLRRGLYAKSKDYDIYELGTKILTPSYISFETVLSKSGVIFQYYDHIYIACYLTRDVSCGEYHFVFKKIHSEILTNPIGIEQKNAYSIASTERAALDTLYLNRDYHFDNISKINWDLINSILPIYDNKRMVKAINAIYKQYKAESL